MTMPIRLQNSMLADGGGRVTPATVSGRQYVNGRWVTVVSTEDGSTSIDASTGSTTGSTTTTTSGSSSTSNKAEYEEETYDFIEGSLEVLKADMSIKCRGAVDVKGLGKVFSGTYYVSEVKVSLNANAMKQTLKLHKDSLTETTYNASSSSRSTPVDTKSSSRTYTVKRGDNLWKISREQLGKGNRWKEIYELNKSVIGKNSSLIYAGQVFVLP